MTLRVGRIAALNMYPLYHHLEEHAVDGFTFTDGVPTQLNRALVTGDLHVSAMSSIEYARHAEHLELLPVASITAAGAVDSIQVFSQVPFDQITRVAVTGDSATSVALLGILAAPGVERVPLQGSPHEALAQGDAVLLIGDEALEGVRAGLAPITTDLGELWSQRTGMPMVFAVWAARRDLPDAKRPALEALARHLHDAQGAFHAHPAEVQHAAAERFPFDPAFVASYLERLSYGFGSAERSALTHFYELAVQTGQLDRVPHMAAPPFASHLKGT